MVVGDWCLPFPREQRSTLPGTGVAYCAEDTLILEHPAGESYAYYSVFSGVESMNVTSGADVV